MVQSEIWAETPWASKMLDQHDGRGAQVARTGGVAEDGHLARLSQERQRVVHGAQRLPPAVPGDDDIVADFASGPAGRQDQHRRAGFEERAVERAMPDEVARHAARRRRDDEIDAMGDALVASASLIATIVSSPSTPFDPNPPPMCSATTRTLPGVELEMLRGATGTEGVVAYGLF